MDLSAEKERNQEYELSDKVLQEASHIKKQSSIELSFEVTHSFPLLMDNIRCE